MVEVEAVTWSSSTLHIWARLQQKLMSIPPILYGLLPQPLPLSPCMSGRHRQVDRERERQTRAPQVLTKKCMDCEITPGLDNLPPQWNPWGTEIINLLISYTLLFPFFLEKNNCKSPSHQDPMSVTWRQMMLLKKYILCCHIDRKGSQGVRPLPSPHPFPPDLQGHTEAECFWRCMVFSIHSTGLFHLH